MAIYDDELAVIELLFAASENNVEGIRNLVAKGIPVHAGDYDSRTALHLAARYNRSSCIRILIEAGADIDAIDKDKATPLTLAAWVKDCASIEILNSLKARMGHLDHECRTNIEKCYSGKFIIKRRK